MPVLHIDISSDLWYMEDNNNTENGNDTEKNTTISSFELDSTATTTLGNPASIWGTLKFNEDGKTSYDILKSEFNSIKWTSSDQDIVANNEITCSGPDPQDTYTSNFFLSINPKKEGTVTITGKTSNGLIKSCVVTIDSGILEFEKTDYVGKKGEIISVMVNLSSTTGSAENLSNTIDWKFKKENIAQIKDKTISTYIDSGINHALITLSVQLNNSGSTELTGTLPNGVSTSCMIRADGVVTLKYRATNEDDFDNTSHDYYYSDKYFYSDSTNYNNSLAIMSLGLELASFSDPTVDGMYATNTNLNERAANLKDAYNKLCFNNTKYYNYNTSLDDISDKVAFSFANKSVSNGASRDTLVAVVIRGGGYGAEWASNFHIGTEGDVTGFSKAAKGVLDELKNYLLARNNAGDIVGDLKLWIVGFSRGAATANILAHYINSGELSDSIPNIRQSNTYAYTFATPNGYYKDSSSVYDDDNIINIVSANDFVPRLALSNWGFSKYGTTFVLPEFITKQIKRSFKNLTNEKINCKWSNNDLEHLTSALNTVADSRVAFSIKLEIALMDYFAKKYSGHPLSNKEIYQRCLIDLALGYMVDDTNLKELSSALRNALSGISGTMLSEKSIHLFKGIALSHYPEFYLSWLESGGFVQEVTSDTYANLPDSQRNEIDKFITNVIFNYTFNNIKWTFYCPVDINVYDSSGVLVASIVNDEVLVEDLPCYVDGDKKVVYLIEGETYSLELVGNDKGTMDYTVEELNNHSEVVRDVYYYDVPLEKSITYKATVSPGVCYRDNYGITDGEITTIPAFDSLSANCDKHNITVKNGVSVKSEAAEGESVSIVAIVNDGYEFVKWTSNVGNTVFNDVTQEKTRFRMPGKNITIKAILKDKSKEDNNTVSGNFQKYGITIQNGTADKTKATEGEVITITANAAPNGQIFNCWTSNDVSFTNAKNTITTFIMPNKAVKITATYKSNPYLTRKSDQTLNLKYGLTLTRPLGSKLTQRVSGAQTSVTFTSSNPKVARIDKTSGKITCVGVGTTVITANAEESSQYKAASKQVKMTVVPKKVGIKSVKSKKKGQVVIKVAKAKGISGYQIQYKNNGRTRKLSVKSRKALTKTIKDLKSGKSLKVRIRAYKKTGGRTYFGNYSKWKTLKKVR